MSEELDSEDLYAAKLTTEIDKTQQKAKLGLAREKMSSSQKTWKETTTVLRQKDNQQVILVNPAANMTGAALTRLIAMVLHLGTGDTIMTANLPGLRSKDLARKAFETRKRNPCGSYFYLLFQVESRFVGGQIGSNW